MDRCEVERRVIFESGSAIANHSINQKSLKVEYDRARRFVQCVPRKVEMAKRRRARRFKEAEQEKVERILGRVLAVFNGYDGFDPEVFKSEVAFLKRNGVNPCLVPEEVPD